MVAMKTRTFTFPYHHHALDDPIMLTVVYTPGVLLGYDSIRSVMTTEDKMNLILSMLDQDVWDDILAAAEIHNETPEVENPPSESL